MISLIWLVLTVTLWANPIPIYSFPDQCIDPRFPTLHKGWIVGCDPRGMVDRAYHIESMKTVRFPKEVEYVGLGDVIQLGSLGVFDLSNQKWNKKIRIRKSNAPSVQLGQQWAYTSAHGVHIQEGNVSRKIQAHPRGWYAPAWWNNSIVWVEDDGKGGEALWKWNTKQGVEPLLQSQENQRHPVAQEDRLVWVEDHAIGVWEYGHLPRYISARVVGRVALTKERLCWSQRAKDIDIHCTNGFVLSREKHQLWPSMWREYLLFREDGQLMLYKFEHHE